MPETFQVEVCYDKPCTWTPPPTHSGGRDGQQTLPRVEGHHSQVENGNLPVPGEYGEHRSSDLRKRAPQPEPQTDSRQGPPLPEPPHRHDNGEPIEIIEHNAMSDVDPEVEQLALDRQEATHTVQRSRRPASFVNHMDPRYILRPEAIESVFYMWRI